MWSMTRGDAGLAKLLQRKLYTCLNYRYSIVTFLGGYALSLLAALYLGKVKLSVLELIFDIKIKKRRLWVCSGRMKNACL